MVQTQCCLLHGCAAAEPSLAEQPLSRAPSLSLPQQAPCGTVSAALADWLLGGRPVSVRQAPYVPSTNLEEWVTQKCVSEPSQVTLGALTCFGTEGRAQCLIANRICWEFNLLYYASFSCSADALALTNCMQTVTEHCL